MQDKHAATGESVLAKLTEIEQHLVSPSTGKMIKVDPSIQLGITAQDMPHLNAVELARLDASSLNLLETARTSLRIEAYTYYNKIIASTRSMSVISGSIVQEYLMSDQEQQTRIANSISTWYRGGEQALLDRVLARCPDIESRSPGISSEHLEVLEEAFSYNTHPNSAERARLAAHIGVQVKQVTFWFQNRRFRLAHKGTESTARLPAAPMVVSQKGVASAADAMHSSARKLCPLSTARPSANNGRMDRSKPPGQPASPSNAINHADANTPLAGPDASFDGSLVSLSSIGPMEIITLDDGSIAYRPSRQPSISGSASPIPSFGSSPSTAPSLDTNNGLPPTPIDGLSLSFAAKQAAQRVPETDLMAKSGNEEAKKLQAHDNARQYQMVTLGVGQDPDTPARRAVKAMPKRKAVLTGSGSIGNLASIPSSSTSRMSGTAQSTTAKKIVTYSLSEFAIPEIPAGRASHATPSGGSAGPASIPTSLLRTPFLSIDPSPTSPGYRSPSQLVSIKSSAQTSPIDIDNPHLLTHSTSLTSLLSATSDGLVTRGNDRVPSLTRSCSAGSALSIAVNGEVPEVPVDGYVGANMRVASHGWVGGNRNGADGQLSSLGRTGAVASGGAFVYAEPHGVFLPASPTELHHSGFHYTVNPYKPTYPVDNQYISMDHADYFNFDLPAPANAIPTSALAQSSFDPFLVPSVFSQADNPENTAYEFEQVFFEALPFGGTGLEDEELSQILMGGDAYGMGMSSPAAVGQAGLDEDGHGGLVESSAQANLPSGQTPADLLALQTPLPATPPLDQAGLYGWDYSAPFEGSAGALEGLEDELWKLLESEEVAGTWGVAQDQFGPCEGSGRAATHGSAADLRPTMPRCNSQEPVVKEGINPIANPPPSLLGDPSLHPAIPDAQYETFEISQLTLEQLQASGWLAEFDQAMLFPQEWGFQTTIANGQGAVPVAGEEWANVQSADQVEGGSVSC